jgi:putative endonuclease
MVWVRGVAPHKELHGIAGNNRSTGTIGEEVASRFLKKHGYKIVKKNFSTPLGEIDIIALDKGIIVFVEVKTRKSRQFGSPQEAIDYRKQKKLSQVASLYLNQKNLNNEKARFDVVAILLSPGQGEKIELIKNAFELII